MRTLIAIFVLSVAAFGQNWSGVLDPTRAIDWSNAGASHINDVRTQCGATIPAGASAATINAAINSCSNGYVLLGPGNFSVASLTFNHKSDITLRGSGSNSTFITFTGGGTCLGGGGHNICADSSDINYFAGPSNTANWTGTNGSAGTYTRGATSITLSSITNLKVGSPIILDQLDDQTDNGSLYVGCEINDGSSACYVGAGPNGFERGSGALGTIRGQQQMVNVTDCRTDHSTTRGAACNVTGITITPGIYAANWQTSHSPGAWWATNPVFNDAVENLSITEGAGDGIDFVNCTGCWVKGVRAVRTTTTGGAYFHVNFFMSNHGTARDSYFFGFDGDSYQITSSIASDLLVENNIIQRPGGVAFNSDCEGCVIAYNYYVNPTANTTTTLSASFIDHGIKLYLLDEGNIGTGQYLDSFHGTHDLSTVFRTVASGEDRNNGVLTNGWGSFPLWFNPGTRYQNAIGNVLGTAGYHDTYMVKPGQTSGNPIINAGIYPGQTATDALSSSTSMFWGNWDSVTNAVRWNANEVPSSGLPASNAYANTLPADHNLPNSFYLSSKPSWIPASKPWPLIGPEVTGGNVGQCVGGTMSASHCTATSQCAGGGSCSLVASGLAYSSPAMDCYLTTMGGAASGNVTTPYAFDASACYSAVAPPTFTISGTVTVGAGFANPNPGVTVSCPACTPTSTTTDGAGAYTFGSENGGGNYVLTPSKTGYTFSPASTTFNNLSANQTANFTAFQPPVPSCSPSGGIYKSGRLISCTDAISAATICWRIGSPPTTSNGTCTAGTTYIAPFMVSATGTLFVTGTQSGNTDSSTSYSFTINPTWTTGWIMNSPATGSTTFGSTLRTYAGLTSLAIATIPTPPNVGGIAGAGTIFTDPVYGTRGVRLTDACFDPSMAKVSATCPNSNGIIDNGNNSYSGSQTGSADDLEFNTGDFLTIVANQGGAHYLVGFNPTTLAISRPYAKDAVGNPITTGCPIANCSSRGGWATFDSLDMSLKDPCTVFDTNNTAITSYTFGSDVVPWTNPCSGLIVGPPAPATVVELVEPSAKCLPLDFGTPVWTNSGGESIGDALLVRAFSSANYYAHPAWKATNAYSLNSQIKPLTNNPNHYTFVVTVAGTSGSTEPNWNLTCPALNNTCTDGTVTWKNQNVIANQGTGFYVVAYSPTKGCISYNTSTGAILADSANAPDGVGWQGGSGLTCDASGCSGTSTANAGAQFTIHNVKMNKSGNAISISPTYNLSGTGACQWQWIWVPGTTTVYCSQVNKASGHWVLGQKGMINDPGSPLYQFFYRLEPAAGPSGTPVAINTIPSSPVCTINSDQHSSYQSADVNDTWPFLSGRSNATIANSGLMPFDPPVCPWVNELVMVDMNGSGLSHRVAFTFNTGFSIFFNSQWGIPELSPSGRFASAGSDWLNNLRNAAGTAACNGIASPTATCIPNGPAWKTAKVYALNYIINPTTTNAGNFSYRATVAGTSGASQPLWSTNCVTVGSTCSDNGITWTNVGSPAGVNAPGTDAFLWDLLSAR